jgi:hypothetical protein
MITKDDNIIDNIKNDNMKNDNMINRMTEKVITCKK